MFIFDITFLTLIINEMKTNLMYVAAALLLVAFTPKASETTLIQGRIEGGTADQVTAFVLDYNINETGRFSSGTSGANRLARL